MIVYISSMGRIKIVSDEAVLDGLLSAIAVIGPSGLTFSKASAAVGLASATLVQRFGTRDAMIEAVLMHAWDQLAARTVAADNEFPLNPGGAISLLLRLMPGSAAEYNFAEGLLLLREDLRNPKLRARGCAWGQYLADALSRRLGPNAEDAEQLGWQMLAIWQGGGIWWAFKRDGDPEDAVRTVLEQWCRNVGI
jgi:AcrR family transcriptional regulator